MSPNVGNFVHDLVEMAKAMETLPQVQAELSRARAENDILADEIGRIKADLEQSRNYAASLEQKVKTTEAERDDAELRFLELDEKAHKALGMLEMVEAYAKDARLVIEPPKPQPEPEAQPQPPVSEVVHSIEPQPQGQGETSPTGEQPHGLPDTTSPTPQPSASQDQREVNPSGATSANTGATQENAGQSPVTPSDAGSNTAGQEGGGVKSDTYTGKRYYNYPFYVPHSEWIAGGGTEEDYNWRPASGQTF